MSAARGDIGFERRIGYSFVGLMAGNAFLLLWQLGMALREHQEGCAIALL